MRPFLAIGTVIADRFEVGPIAGSGGMGTVYRALDRSTGSPVALKVLHKIGSDLREIRRFVREARILSRLSHPGITSYVANGQTQEGLNYLVMEWLQGEDLAQRKTRAALTVGQGRLLLQHVAEVLACAHPAGIVHRDIKPSNLFLCDGQFDRVVLIDFGVAHYRERATQSALTLAGTLIGTLEYVSPEQARADGHVGPASDIYSLGRVVYQGLAGWKRSGPAHVAAMLAKTLFEDDPPLETVCPWIPRPLSALIARMMAKDPARRPPDGAALLAELSALGPLPAAVCTPIAAEQSVEYQVDIGQGLYSVVLAVPASTAAPEEITSSDEDTRSARDIQCALDGTLLRHGTFPSWLLDGSLLVTMPPSDSAHDQAMRAGCCALLIKTRWPAAEVALATGRGQVFGQSLIGEVVDRAAALLRRRQAGAGAGAAGAAIPFGSVWVDDLTAALLQRRFLVIPMQGDNLLTGEAMSSEELRPVLGTLPPCLGREQELTLLEAVLDKCRDDSESQAVLITAPPGFGKTRLHQEFRNRVQRRSWHATQLLATGDILTAGAPYALIGRVVRRLCAIASGESAVAAWQRLSKYCTELLGARRGSRAAAFLCELCGLTAPEVDRELLAARREPKAMFAHLLQTLQEVLQALCEHAPVVLILDDLHFGDRLSLQLICGLLRESEGQPFMVVALGRPEVKDDFPELSQWPRIKDIPLDGLSRGASEQLVCLTLRDEATPEVVTHIAHQAAGNVLLLEELIRAKREDRGRAVPDTVLAIVQARMQRMGQSERMVLGAASIFGQRFVGAGIQALLDRTAIEHDVEPTLLVLRQVEVLAVRQPNQPDGQAEYSFRHALMREAAYSLLLPEQQQRWHRIAAEFLLQTGEPDALVLAEHFSRSDAAPRAGRFYVQAAVRALDASDLSQVRRLTQRGLECQPPDPERAELLGLLAVALFRAEEYVESHRVSEEALHWLTPGSVRFCQVLVPLLSAAFLSERKGELAELTGRLLAAEPPPEAIPTYLETIFNRLSAASAAGQRQDSLTLLGRMQAVAQGTSPNDPKVMLWLYWAQQRLAQRLDGDSFRAWLAAEQALDAARRVGIRRWIGVLQGEAALAELELGAAHAEGRLRAAIELLRPLEEEAAQSYLTAWLAYWLAPAPERADEAADLAHVVLRRNARNPLVAGLARWALSRSAAAKGAFARAESEVREAMAMMKPAPPVQIGLRAQLVHTLLQQGRGQQALEAAQQGLDLLDSLGGSGPHELALRLAAIEALRAVGDRSGAITALRAALALLAARAAAIADPACRQSYCENVVAHARLLALGRELLIEPLP